MANYRLNCTDTKRRSHRHRPITCLPTTCKLLSGVIFNRISRHLESNRVLAAEQKGVWPGSRGTNEQL